MELCTVYVTHSNIREAEAIARELLKRRLVACANILPAIRSLYWWQGEIQDSSEVALMAKARLKDFKEIAKLVRKLHSYDTPCIVAWPLEKEDKDYAKWIVAETRRTQAKSASKSKDTGQ
jgi:periplasmic divalent cation tolerance protein